MWNVHISSDVDSSLKQVSSRWLHADPNNKRDKLIQRRPQHQHHEALVRHKHQHPDSNPTKIEIEHNNDKKQYILDKYLLEQLHWVI